MKRFLGISLLFILVTLLAVSIPASANTGTAGGPRIPVTRSTSSNWSGYAVETNLTSPANYAVTNVLGQWTVPVVSKSRGSTYSAIWVGIDGYSDSTVEQIGTEQDWTGGAVYYAWYEMYPNASYRIPYAVYPGDAMLGNVTYDNGQFILTLSDSTQGWTFTTTQTASGALRQSAEWVVEAPWLGKVLPLANFGTVTFTGASATLSGTTGTISSWPYDPITMVDGKATATPSPLSPDGSSFTVTYGSSSSGGNGNGNGNHGNPHN
jgi:Peptidase A4 family